MKDWISLSGSQRTIHVVTCELPAQAQHCEVGDREAREIAIRQSYSSHKGAALDMQLS